MSLLETKFKFAQALIREAGAYIKEKMSEEIDVFQKTSHTDVVTQIDHQVQDLLIGVIQTLYPNDHILAEEDNRIHPISDGNVWVIDPIDGTANFIAQRDDFVIMMSYFEDGVGQFGCIYDVMKDILYSGGPHFKPMANNQELKPYETKPMACQMMISNAGMYARNDYGLADLIDKSLGCRTYGSAGISMIRVMSGKAMAYFSYICPWDYAAASVIGQSLGYDILTLEGEKPDFQTRQKVMFVPRLAYDMIKQELTS